MRLYDHVIICGTILCLLACHKPPKTSDRAKSILIGNPIHFSRTVVNTLLEGEYFNPAIVDYDINQDGILDIRLISAVEGSPGVGMLPEASVVALHDDLKIMTYTSSDSVWLKSICDTVDDGAQITYYKTNSYNCNRQNAEYYFHSANLKEHLKLYSLMDSLSTTDSASSNPISIHHTDFSFDPQWAEIGTDTFLVVNENNRTTCWIPESLKQHYLGFVLTENGEKRMGWISWKKNGHILEIHEYAIQD